MTIADLKGRRPNRFQKPFRRHRTLGSAGEFSVLGDGSASAHDRETLEILPSHLYPSLGTSLRLLGAGNHSALIFVLLFHDMPSLHGRAH
jgi:hypothetical protein